MEGIADDDDFDLVLAEEAADGFEVRAQGGGAGAGAMQGEERLGGQAQGVRDGEADAAISNVQSERAAMSHKGSVRLGCAEWPKAG